MNWQQEQAPLPSNLRKLFTAYRESAIDPEPSVNFMPTLWERIDARRRTTNSFSRLARAFVTAAAGICLLMTAGIAVQSNSVTNISYVDLLDDVDEAEAEAERL